MAKTKTTPLGIVAQLLADAPAVLAAPAAPAVSMASFQAAGHAAGARDVARWEQNGAELAELLPQLPTWDKATYDAVRGAWVAGYMGAYDCTEKRAGNAWREAFNAACEMVPGGLRKPQNADAAKRAARRAAAKPDAADKSPDAGNVQSPAEGGEVAGAVLGKLSAIEEHIVSLMRRGKFKDAIDLLHSEAERVHA